MNHSNTKQYDLSLGQKSLWFIQALGGNAQSAYNESLTYSLDGYLSIALLKQAFTEIMAKHPILRTAFKKTDEGNLFQCIQDNVDLDFTHFTLSINENLDHTIVELIKKPFDFAKAPLLRITLIKKSENQHILVIVMPHIITDGTSFAILIQDLNNFYNTLLGGNKIEWTPAEKNYFDHVALEKQKIHSAAYQLQVEAVANTLKESTSLNFLTTPLSQDQFDWYSGDRVYFEIDPLLFKNIQQFSQERKTTFFHFLFSIFSIILSKYTRSLDMAIGVPFANRGNDPARQILGYFVNTLPLRIKLNNESSFSEILKEVQALIFSFLGKQDCAFEDVTHTLNSDRNLAQHSLIQTMFAFSSLDKVKLSFEGINATLEQRYHAHAAKFDLSLFMFEENKQSISAYFEYRSTLFDRASVERIAKSFTRLISNVLQNPEQKLPMISLIDEAEKNWMKSKLFNAKLDRVVTTHLGQLFSDSASHFKNHTGLIVGNKRYTYQEIDIVSNQWANYIRVQYRSVYGKEMPRDTLVGLCIDRNEDMIFAMLGILKAGAGYVPIDPYYPQERIQYIIEHSQVPLLMTHICHHTLEFGLPSERIINMDDASTLAHVHSLSSEIISNIQPQDVAYVLYTSGSTGKPKGVAVTHENVICLFESLKKQFEFSERDIWALFHTYCFDISVWEIWGAFLFGGALLMVPFETTRNPKEFYQLLLTEKVTVLSQTASAFQMLINEDLQNPHHLKHLRYVGFVGESLKVSILRPWVEKYGTQQPQLANLYGITETTVYTNYKFIKQSDIDKGRDNIGWPLEEFSMCILDENLQWCPIGIVGEIAIGGRGLSRGYLYRDDLTQQKFIQDPHAEFLGLEKNSRLYLTGDLGRWLEDGSIEYLGRKDFQIKLRGFRIELGEIEAALGSYPGISHTAVLLKGEGDAAYLAAYYTTKSQQLIDLAKLKTHLKSFLPEYMQPKTFSEIASFPMTMNGKIDRQKLMAYQDKVTLNQEVTLKNAEELAIAEIWATLLNIDVKTVGSTSNFFELGGNSLLVIKMLALVNKKINIDLPLSQFIAAPLLSTLSGTTDLQKNVEQFLHRLKKDLQLDLGIQPQQNLNPNLYTPKYILLTGATGFLGAHLLHELLTQTTADIYCLVRSASKAEALSKLDEKLTKYGFNDSTFYNRIIPILGHLDQPHLGLSVETYNEIINKTDAIYHVGALVHHVYDYQTLYPTNVNSVRELLKIATTEKNKALHFISTLATQYISPLEISTSLEKVTLQTQLNMNGYLSTKWMAEQLLNAAHARGIAAFTYRPGNIIAGKNGVYEAESNHTLLRLKGLLQLQKAYVGRDESVEMMPVDLLSTAILNLSFKPTQQAYNLHNADNISWQDYLIQAKNKGYSLNFIDKNQWQNLIKNIDEKNALYKLSHVYNMEPATENKGEKKLSADHGLSLPSYQEMIDQQLAALIKNGFLPSPQKIVEIA